MNDADGDSSCPHSWAQIITNDIQEIEPFQVFAAAGDINRPSCEDY